MTSASGLRASRRRSPTATWTEPPDASGFVIAEVLGERAQVRLGDRSWAWAIVRSGARAGARITELDDGQGGGGRVEVGAGEDGGELFAGGDGELLVCVGEVTFDGSSGDEELWAISRLERPAAASCTTRRSLGVSDSSPLRISRRGRPPAAMSSVRVRLVRASAPQRWARSSAAAGSRGSRLAVPRAGGLPRGRPVRGRARVSPWNSRACVSPGAAVRSVLPPSARPAARSAIPSARWPPKALASATSSAASALASVSCRGRVARGRRRAPWRRRRARAAKAIEGHRRREARRAAAGRSSARRSLPRAASSQPPWIIVGKRSASA